MTDSSRSLIVGVMDRSGSMAPYENIFSEGWANLLKEAAAERTTFASLYEFADTVQPVYLWAEADEAPAYRMHAGGFTALHNAMGYAITHTGATLAGMEEDQRPDDVTVTIWTDGQNNVHSGYTRERVHEMVLHQQDKYGWKFIFNGANQDAVLVGSKLGVPAETSMTYATSRSADAFAATTDMYVRGTRTGLYGYSDEERARSAG